MPPVRIQRQRAKGWRMPAGAVYVGRPSRWGNPFKVPPFAAALRLGCRGDKAGCHEAAVKVFRMWADGGFKETTDTRNPFEREFMTVSVLREPPTIDEIRAELRGKDLACWCSLERPCHADVLLELANERTD